MNYKLIIMTKVKNLLLTILLLCGTTIWGNNGLRISGRIKVLKPTTLQIKDMNEAKNYLTYKIKLYEQDKLEEILKENV